jgi:uncharacterized protein (TIGR03435 family)
MASIPELLSGHVTLEVECLDRLYLNGARFDIDLQWTPDELDSNAGLFTALREQLGLKLESIRTGVETSALDQLQ